MAPCSMVSGARRRRTAGPAPAQVKEALMTSALLKLPQSTPYPRKEERVEQILSELVRRPASGWPWLGTERRGAAASWGSPPERAHTEAGSTA